MTTYRIEARENGRWIPAPGESSGWTLKEARRAVELDIYGLDGSRIDSRDVRIVDEATGDVVTDD
jgi:hypothetical protein